MNQKERITLTKEQETLLIPLYSKAQINPILVDEKAREILEGIQYDFNKLKIPQKTEVTLRIRAKQLDNFTREFLHEHPDAMVLHLGCGLDSRCVRVGQGHIPWYDVDLPDVIALRKKFFPETETYHLIGSSVTDLSWLEQISEKERPVFIVAEGLLMYLSEDDVRALILSLRSHFPGCQMVFDAFSKMTADRVQAHPSLHKTGASIKWGIDDPHEIETWADGIHLQKEWFFSQSSDINKLSWFYRSMFRLTASIKAAQQAQRILYYSL